MNAPVNTSYVPPRVDTMDALFVQPRVNTAHGVIDGKRIEYTKGCEWSHTFVYGDASITAHVVPEPESCIITLTGHGSVDIAHYNQRTRLRTRLPIGVATRVSHADPRRLRLLQLLDMGQYGSNVVAIINGGQPCLDPIYEGLDASIVLIDQTPNPRYTR